MPAERVKNPTCRICEKEGELWKIKKVGTICISCMKLIGEAYADLQAYGEEVKPPVNP